MSHPRLKSLSYCLSILSFTLLLSSCAPVSRPVQPYCNIPGSQMIHIVAPKETLWRISQVYNVSMQDIIRANSLREPVVLLQGQRLVIPRSTVSRADIPLFPANRWKYIIVHHSATDIGDANTLNILHKRRGWNEIGYDFVIDNGTKGKADGAIEVSPRWIKQEDGAHCRAANMNYQGIGICLVGNFSQERVSGKQMDSLVYLVNTLRKYYHIPANRVLGHGQVRGAHTECPGKYFSWGEFRRKLANCN